MIHSAGSRRSRAIRLGALGALSLALAACSSSVTDVASQDADYTGPPGGYAVDDSSSPQSDAPPPDPDPAPLLDDGSSAYCVEDDGSGDGSYAVVDDDNCDDDYENSHAHRYYHYYGGSPLGSRISGGSTIKPPGSAGGTNSGSITRGGLGNRSGSSGG